MLPMKRCLFLFPLLLLTACQPENTETPADPQAMYDKAQALLKPNVENGQSDFAGAMQWLLKAAEGGLMRAQLDLGGIYFAGGQGVQPDAQKAYNWFSLPLPRAVRRLRCSWGFCTTAVVWVPGIRRLP